MKKIKEITVISIIGLISFYLYSFVSKETINQEQLIKNIFSYPMDDIVKRCQKEHSYTAEDMIILEKELKKYLVLAALTTAKELGVGMYSKDVDNLWHTFILFTKDYADFCNSYIKHFVHHLPETDHSQTPEKRVKARQDFHAFIKKYENIFHEDIHPIWFLDMCENDISTEQLTA